MDLSVSTLWWLAVGALVAAELATGTFYLLMVALGCAAGAVAAHAGLNLAVQVVVAAVVGVVATSVWHLQRARLPRGAPAQSNPDVLLDIGQAVHVQAWQPDGSTRVQYRGASWAARHAGAGTPVAGDHVIVALDGNELRLALASPAAAALNPT